MKSNDIREKFLSYFEDVGHQRVKSSALVPRNDPTLLFTNAGMVQFKDVFLGQEKLDFNRATSSQRCVRAGGKHNDLENVGYTARHHTFFEMLGNFSFGDYFKRDAIKFSWELITKEFELDPKRLLVTVYESDEEAYEIWKNVIKLPDTKIIRIGDKKGGQKYQSDNFWQMGDTGPCGPCSEIFWDHGSNVSGGPPGSLDEDGDRFIEIWNLVFMQFNRDAGGELKKLPKPSVDTGMGLERMAAVLQGVHSNYEIDMFRALITAASQVTLSEDLKSNSLKVIADHIRACSFLIVDGILPSNEGRGYVLRRIIRRAIRHGYKLGQKLPFFHKLVPHLILEMGDAYPELSTKADDISAILYQEEIRFAQTLDNGMELLERAIKAEHKVLNGDTIFKLYDTFGFPVDLTADVAREKNMELDLDGFESAMSKQRKRARASSKFQKDGIVSYSGDETEFCGYDRLVSEATVMAIYKNSADTGFLGAGETGVVVLNRTPFYAEAGGQVGDRGKLIVKKKSSRFEVTDTQLIQGGVVGHHVVTKEGNITVGDIVEAEVDIKLRHEAACNHSATHLMHAALQKTLGTHVQQKGSLVDEFKTRFDFSNNKPLTHENVKTIENLVNEQIRLNKEIVSNVMSHDLAVKEGAVALFGEKYGKTVRVIDIGNFSKELCGGTHVEKCGDIGFFKIIDETGVASGVRRIEAITGQRAVDRAQSDSRALENIKFTLKSGGEGLQEKIEQLLNTVKDLEKENYRLQGKLLFRHSEELLKKTVIIKNIKLISSIVENVDIGALRQITDQIKTKLGTGIIVLATVKKNNVLLVAGVTDDLTKQYKAGELVGYVAKLVDGKGGGRPAMAQGGGINVEKLPMALDSIKKWINNGSKND